MLNCNLKDGIFNSYRKTIILNTKTRTLIPFLLKTTHKSVQSVHVFKVKCFYCRYEGQDNSTGLVIGSLNMNGTGMTNCSWHHCQHVRKTKPGLWIRGMKARLPSLCQWDAGSSKRNSKYGHKCQRAEWYKSVIAAYTALIVIILSFSQLLSFILIVLIIAVVMVVATKKWK